MMRDAVGELAAHLERLPGHRVFAILILVRAELFQVANLRQVKAPQVVH